MTPRAAAERLERAEREYRQAQWQHDGSLSSVERYRAAASELALAAKIAKVILDAAFAQGEG